MYISIANQSYELHISFVPSWPAAVTTANERVMSNAAANVRPPIIAQVQHNICVSRFTNNRKCSRRIASGWIGPDIEMTAEYWQRP